MPRWTHCLPVVLLASLLPSAAEAQFKRMKVAADAVIAGPNRGGVAVSKGRVAWVTNEGLRTWAAGTTALLAANASFASPQLNYSLTDLLVVGWIDDDVVALGTFLSASGPGSVLYRVSKTGVATVVQTSTQATGSVLGPTVGANALGFLYSSVAAQENSVETEVLGRRARRQAEAFSSNFGFASVGVDRSRAYFVGGTALTQALYEAGANSTARTQVAAVPNAQPNNTPCPVSNVSADEDAVAFGACGTSIVTNLGGAVNTAVTSGTAVPDAPPSKVAPNIGFVRLRKGAIAFTDSDAVFVLRAGALTAVFSRSRDFSEFNPTPITAIDFDGVDVAYVGEQSTPTVSREVWLATGPTPSASDAGVDSGPSTPPPAPGPSSSTPAPTPSASSSSSGGASPAASADDGCGVAHGPTTDFSAASTLGLAVAVLLRVRRRRRHQH